MGRIKTTMVKRATLEIVKDHRGELKEDFESNKKIVDRFAEFPSKKVRNIVAGYVTRLMKRKEEL